MGNYVLPEDTYLIQRETLTAMGDAIRAKTGETERLKPMDMVAAIGGLGKALPFIKKIDGGIYMSTTDVTAAIELEHTLGEVPDFFIMIPNQDTSSSSSAPHKMAEFFVSKKYYGGSSPYVGFHYAIYRLSDGSTSSGNTNLTSVDKYATDTTIKLSASSAIPFKANVGYMWICCTFENYLGD